jgi:hypothetical protein
VLIDFLLRMAVAGSLHRKHAVRCDLCVARSRQVYIEWLEATVLSIYLPEEKRTFICTYLSEAALLPEATFPLGPAQLNL